MFHHRSIHGIDQSGQPSLAAAIVLDVAEAPCARRSRCRGRTPSRPRSSRARSPARPSRPGRSRGCSRSRRGAARPSCSARRAGTTRAPCCSGRRRCRRSPRRSAARGPSTARPAGSSTAAPSARGRSRSSAARRRTCSPTDFRGAASDAESSDRPFPVPRAMSPREPLRVNAPVSRFSSTVRCAKQWRPSITWHTPRRTRSFGVSRSIRSPRYSIVPLVTSPRSARSRLEIAFSVVVLPAPFAPSSATMPPSGTSSDTPFSTRIT